MMMYKIIDDYMATINQSINQSINQTIDLSINQSINQSTKQSINQSFINQLSIDANTRAKAVRIPSSGIFSPSTEFNKQFVSWLGCDISRLWNKTP